MQVELRVQPGTMVDLAAMIEFARRGLPLEHSRAREDSRCLPR